MNLDAAKDIVMVSVLENSIILFQSVFHGTDARVLLAEIAAEPFHFVLNQAMSENV